MMRFLPAILISLAVQSTGIGAFDDPKEARENSLQDQCDVLFKEYADAQRRYVEGTHRAKTDEEARRFVAPDDRGYAARFMAMAREHPDDPVAADALTRAMLVDFGGSFWKEAIERIGRRHVKSPKIALALGMMAFDTTLPNVEPLLRKVLEENPHEEVQAQAALALARHLRRLIGEAENMRKYPDRFERAASEFGRESTTQIRDRDLPATRRETEALYELVIRNYADIQAKEGPSPAVKAEVALHELRDLVVGRPAPEIAGVDVDGKPMTLDEYRGKVVVLVFWATWCGPCMANVPQERELVRRMVGKPFVLIGVNGDEDEERLRHQIRENEISWRSFADRGPDGPIATAWNVNGWPTVYVIDPGGVIRYKGHRKVKEWEEVVEKLLAGES